MEKLKIKKGTIIRTIVLGLALINQILVTCGKSALPFEEAEIEACVSTFITVAAAAWAWWKNNSFTQSALCGDVQKGYCKTVNDDMLVDLTENKEENANE